ncbi:MAG: RNA polymerase sigma factor [Chloroflexota bacterium]
MIDDYRRGDERALIAGAQNGALSATAQLVSLHQAELVRTAFLLTNSHARALLLSEEAFKRAFAGISRSDPESPFRPVLLNHLVRVFLNPPAHVATYDAGWSDSGPAGRYQVENAKARCRQELALLDPPMRAALVLEEFNELDLDTVSGATGQSSDHLRGQIDRAGSRLKDRLSLTGARSLRIALNEAAIDAPRQDLWEQIEDDVAQVLAEQQRRSRITTIAIAIVVALVVVGGSAALVAGALSGEDESDPPGVNRGAGPASPLEPGTAQAIEPVEPTPTEAIYEPVGDIPDRLIVEQHTRSQGRADIRSGLVGAGGELGTWLDGAIVALSPDGGTAISIDEDITGGDAIWTVRAIDLRDGTVRWTENVGPVLVGADYPPPIDVAINRGRVLIGWIDPEAEPGRVNITRMDLESGAAGSAQELDLDQTVPELHLFTHPGQGDVVIVARSHETGAATIHRVARDTSQAGGLQVETDELEGFAFGRARPTPDGRGVYTAPVSTDSAGGQPSVEFLTFDSPTVARVELPFEDTAGREIRALQAVPSHDGELLYVIDTYERQVAVVDLRRRLLERLMPLDLGAVDVPADGSRLTPSPSLYDADSAALSADARHLFMLAPAHEGDGTLATSIWKVEIATWRVVDHWLRDYPAPIHSLYTGGEGDRLHVYTAMSGSERDSDRRLGHLHVIDTTSGEIETTLDNFPPDASVHGTLASLYLATYGVSPAVEGRVPELITDFTSLPLTDVEIDPAQTGPGESVRIRVQFKDPAEPLDDRPVSPGAQHIRFDPGATVTATVDSGNDRHLVVLGEEEYGVYSASVVVDELASWNLIVDVVPAEGVPWSIEFPSALDTRATFTGSDGRDYQVRLAGVAPEQPRAGSPAEVRFHIVDAETGERLPDDVTLVERLPVRLSVRLESTTPYSFYRSGHGAFSGVFIFPSEGRHYLQIDGFPGTESGAPVLIGPVEVNPPA